MNREEILEYLSTTDRDKLNKLFESARNIRTEMQGDKIFAYGFVYFTTYCRNNCNFCYYRNSNKI